MSIADPLEVVLPGREGRDWPSYMRRIEAWMPDDEERVRSSWDHGDTGETTYVLVDENDVDAEILKATRLGHRFACLHLAPTQTPALRFYRTATHEERAQLKAQGPRSVRAFRAPRGWSGHAQPDTGTMGVRVDETTPAWAAAVAAHEVRHLHAPGRGEADAHGYGEWAAEVLHGRSEPAKAAHAQLGYPYNGVTLAGLADHGDVLIATHDGAKTVWRNEGQKSSPAWVKHYRGCPVD